MGSIGQVDTYAHSPTHSQAAGQVCFKAGDNQAPDGDSDRATHAGHLLLVLRTPRQTHFDIRMTV
jgi:hypothetical protein